MSPIYVPGKVVLAKDYVPVDPYLANVSLLLHGNGTNGSTTIIDSSPSPKTVTTVGDARISTAQSKFGGASIAFDGSGDRLTLAAASDWDFSGGPHTVECWVYLNTLPPTNDNLRLVMAGPNNGLSSFVFFEIDPIGQLSSIVPRSGASRLVHITTLATGQWYHLAVVLNAAYSILYINGIGVQGNITMPTSTLSNQLFIGYDTVYTVGSNFNGYIDDLRITKGVARYTGNFTPPTTPFPDIAIR